ncbi:MAG: response regulator [Candidatus Jettenia caeni]|nr:response regulator [Candidatus Jettenia caeni]
MSEKPQILIVDDEVDMCWALESILIPKGYKSYSVTSGKEGLELLKQLYPSVRLIFLDVKLPDIDGLKLANVIKQYYPEIKIAIITGYYVLLPGYFIRTTGARQRSL